MQCRGLRGQGSCSRTLDLLELYYGLVVMMRAVKLVMTWTVSQASYDDVDNGDGVDISVKDPAGQPIISLSSLPQLS